ncbi:MAG TPA: sulfatase-like hydrolase/transferase [Pirellulales bacterium]
MSRCLVLLLFVCAIPAVARGAEPASKPHILFILADDQRWDTIAALGNGQIKTPNLDALVARGFHFTNAYCMGSMIPAVCQPSRTMLLTGRSLWRIPDPRAKAVPPGVALLPRVMAGAGYKTFHCGKPGNSYPAAHAAFDKNVELAGRTATTATEMADQAIRFIREHETAHPVFMYLAPSVPHDPRLAPQRFTAMYRASEIALPKNFMPRHPFDNGELDVRDELLAERPRMPEEMRQHLADYYATISHLDDEVGRVISALTERGWLENTVVIFSSDQGLAVGGCHGLMGKQNLYEHVKPPLVIAGPGIPRGKSDALVYLFDLFPALCQLAGAPVPAEVEGQSLVGILRGEQKSIRLSLFAAYRGCQRMIRDGRWKLIAYNASGVRNVQLFDLQNDPDELTNLAIDSKHMGERSRLERMLGEARREFGDPVDF